jgi:hypothetical protein
MEKPFNEVTVPLIILEPLNLLQLVSTIKICLNEFILIFLIRFSCPEPEPAFSSSALDVPVGDSETERFLFQRLGPLLSQSRKPLSENLSLPQLCDRLCKRVSDVEKTLNETADKNLALHLSIQELQNQMRGAPKRTRSGVRPESRTRRNSTDSDPDHSGSDKSDTDEE